MSEILIDRSLQLEKRLQSLSQIKLSILGNDKEKSKFLIDPESKFQEIIDVLKYETDEQMLKNAAIIIQSFSYSKKNIEFLMKFDVLEVLISSTIKYPAVLAELNFKTLIDIASLSSSRSSGSFIDLDELKQGDVFIKLMYMLIYNNEIKPSVIFNVSMLIPFIKYHDTSILYKPIMKRLSIILAPIFKQVLYLNNSAADMTDFNYCLENPTPPYPPLSSSIDILDNELSPLLYALCHLLSVLKVKVTLPIPLYYCLTSFLHLSNLNIKLATLNVLIQYSRNHLNGQIQKINNKKLLPPLVELIERTKLLMNDLDFTLNSNYKLSRKMSPLYLLSQLSGSDESTNDFLMGVNFIDKVYDIIQANYNPNQEFMSETSLYKISDCLLILSCVCSSKEEYREIVITFPNLSTILTQSLKKHIDIYNDIDPSNPNDLAILNLSNRLTIFSAYLIRALSRSANLLRTYLVHLNLAELLTNLLRLSDTTLENLPFELREKELLLKSVVLGIISNLIVEFSAIRAELVSHGVSEIVKDFINVSKYDILKQHSLLVIRNSIFGEDSSFKMKLEEIISLDKIFELCYDENENIKLQSINILRNLTAGALSYSDKIISQFPHSPAAIEHKDLDFLGFLTNILNQTTNKEIIISVNYIIVHIAASSPANRSCIMCNDLLLKKLLELLKDMNDPSLKDNTITDNNEAQDQDEDEMDSEDEYDDFWKIKLTCVWIIINLTFRGSSSRESNGMDMDMGEDMYINEDEMDEDMTVDYAISDRDLEVQFKKFLTPRRRAIRLIRLGFYDVIKNLNNCCRILDFKERARTAIFQLVLYDENQGE